MIGKLLNNRYKINNVIGLGGMAIVYDGYDTYLNREVAIKILKDTFANDENFFNKLRDEAKASASLIDDNIVQIYDIENTEVNGKSIDYIVMEKIKGPTLKEFISENAPMHEEKILDFAMQISKALQTAHLQGIVHRDIKPANILINKFGKAKVVDFGIARVVSDATLTYTSSILGTVHYISPEQAKGQPVDSRSDLYSLGVVLYEMATGEVPFDGESPVSIAVKHIQENPKIVSTINPDISENLSHVINKLLAKNPDDRYKTSSNLLIDLNKIRTGNEIISKDDTLILDNNMNSQIQNTEKNNAVYKVSKKEENEEENATNRTKNKILKFSIITILLVMIGFLSNFIISSLFNRIETNLITVPSVIDINEEMAISMLRDIGLQVSIKGRVFHENISSGKVVDQSIKPNRKANANDNIELTISKGKELVKVPDIVGFNLDNIESLIKSYGLEIGEKTTEKSETEKDKIVRQIPAADEMVEKGTKIDIVLSSGPDKKMINVPNVKNQNQNIAITTLRAAGLIPRNISEDYSDSISENNVISQSIEPGKEVETGTSIDIVISIGKYIPETSVETIVETTIETEKEPDVNNDNSNNKSEYKDYSFNLSIPNNDEQTFIVKIIDLNDNNKVVYEKELNKSEANENGTIKVLVNAKSNAKFEVLYNNEKANISYE